MTEELTARYKPVQQRAHKQRQRILMVTAELLEAVGIDELTTILVAKEVGVSIGTLYHYFPNKQAILCALSELWIEQITVAMTEIESEHIESMGLKPFVSLIVDRFAVVYRDSSALLPLVKAMSSMPQLAALNNSYQASVSKGFSEMLLRLNISINKQDATYLAEFYWQISQAVLFNSSRSTMDRKKSLADLKFLLLSLLERARVQF